MVRTATWSVADYRAAHAAAGHGPELHLGEGGLFMFQLSVDGGRSWSRQLPFTIDLNGLSKWRKRWDIKDHHLADRDSFFDTDIRRDRRQDRPRRGLNHIGRWGSVNISMSGGSFATSENLWFGGHRTLDTGEHQRVWWELRDLGKPAGPE